MLSDGRVFASLAGARTSYLFESLDGLVPLFPVILIANPAISLKDVPFSTYSSRLPLTQPKITAYGLSLSVLQYVNNRLFVLFTEIDNKVDIEALKKKIKSSQVR